MNDLPNLAQQGGEASLVSLRYSAAPMGVSVDAAGNAWFGESDPGNPGWRIGRASGGTYTEWSLPCVPSGNPCSGSYTAPAPDASPAPAPTPTPVALQGTTTSVAPGKWKPTADGVSSKQICVGPPNDKCSLIYLLTPVNT